MSASNYRACPKCSHKASTDGADEFLREDYEIGVDSAGVFSIRYLATCQVCDFEFSFSYREVLAKAKAT